MSTYVFDTDDLLDIRQIIERFEELESDRDGFVIGAPDGTETPAPDQWAEENPEDSDELAILEKMLDELRGYGGDEQWRGDWFPGTLIHERYFTDAMRELVEDIGGMPRDAPSYLVIDWEATAENLRVDYSSIEVDGETYWYR
jgi:hypothetical protein